LFHTLRDILFDYIDGRNYSDEKRTCRLIVIIIASEQSRAKGLLLFAAVIVSQDASVGVRAPKRFLFKLSFNRIHETI
jgi:hypothetical protein